MKIILHLEGEKIELDMPFTVRIGETILRNRKTYKIEEIMYGIDDPENIVIATVAKPKPVEDWE
jgi:hypothetical protein